MMEVVDFNGTTMLKNTYDSKGRVIGQDMPNRGHMTWSYDEENRTNTYSEDNALPHVERLQKVPLTEQYAYSVEGQQMIEPKEAIHSKDYEIEWKDPALEEIMRQYLNKPEDPIMHSDVWEIHAVYLRNQYRFFTDTESTDGYLPEEGGVISKEPLPQLTLLEDFQHFDSLQLLELYDQEIGSLNGLEHLQNLTTLNLSSCNITDPAPLSALGKVEKLVLDGNALSSVGPLADMKSLSWLSLRGCGLTDISVLTKLTGLTWLDVSNIEQTPGTIENYAFISKLKRLQYLGLANITDLTDISFCTELKNLKTVDLENSGVDKWM